MNMTNERRTHRPPSVRIRKSTTPEGRKVNVRFFNFIAAVANAFVCLVDDARDRRARIPDI